MPEIHRTAFIAARYRGHRISHQAFSIENMYIGRNSGRQRREKKRRKSRRNVPLFLMVLSIACQAVREKQPFRFFARYPVFLSKKKSLYRQRSKKNVSLLLEYHFSLLRLVNDQCPELRVRNRKCLSSSKSISRLLRCELVSIILQKKIFRYRKEKSKKYFGTFLTSHFS